MSFHSALPVMIATVVSLVSGIIGYYIGGLFNYFFTGAFCSATFAFGAYLAYAVYIANEKEATNLQIFGKKSRCLNKDGQHAGLKLIARPFEKIFKTNIPDRIMRSIPRQSGNMPVPAIRKVPIGIFRERRAVIAPKRKITIPPIHSSFFK